MRVSLILLLLLSLTLTPMGAMAASVHMANGIKIGEVDSDSAIIWTRLTQHAERNLTGPAFLEVAHRANKNYPNWDGSDQIPAGVTIDEMIGAVPGAPGEVRVIFWSEKDQQQHQTPWQAVDPEQDFTHQFHLSDLQAGERYQVRVEGRVDNDSAPSVTVAGTWVTAPAADNATPVKLVVVTCGDYQRRDDAENGHVIYQSIMETIHPDFFVHTGDIEYYDRPVPLAPSPALARFKMNRQYAMPYSRLLHNSTASYFQKDDHDITMNDTWPGKPYGALTWEQGLDIYYENFPMGPQPYRTVRWGKDLQIWLVEGREFRSQNNMPDGPDKTIWGETQKQWFFDSVKDSDATFKLLITPTPIVGPDRANKNDNHSNRGFTTEGDQIRRFVAEQQNLFIVTGDRHWQYHSIDQETGVQEFSVGPHSDVHAGGFSEEMRPEHRFLRVKGGFLSIEVARDGDQPAIVFQHHDVTGKVVYQARFPSSE